ncbi:MAG: helix-turn-helix transcriptional regulator, partial [Actinobacteria bacterium]|nr:helix-turn-helix transcriptional regulator [Actinomycetota bacterium]NIU68262.1 helix-turn-helix transcriptional regulator [Actinomycetota bacterium]NIW30067.1 ArsR family transcriptional regulator [Actinomycetota bacterium]
MASTTSDPDGSPTNEAFHLLSNETRLELMQALWAAYDPVDEEPMRFAELREEVTADDPGGIYYHLDKLTTHFVRRTEEGYELRESGKRIARIVLSGTAIDDPEIEPVAVD